VEFEIAKQGLELTFLLTRKLMELEEQTSGISGWGGSRAGFPNSGMVGDYCDGLKVDLR